MVSIRFKLFIAFVILTLISILTGYFSYISTQSNNNSFQQIIDSDTPRILALLEMKSISSEIELYLFTIQLSEYGETQSETTTASDQKYRLLARLEKLKSWLNIYGENLHTSDTQKINFLSNLEEVKSEIIASSLNYISARENNMDEQVLSVHREELNAHVVELRALIEEATVREVEDLSIEKRHADERIKQNLTVTLLMSIGSSLVAISFWFFLQKMLVAPLRKLRDAAHAVAGGNLSNVISVESHDEIGDLAVAFNNMTQRLRESHEVLIESNDELEKAQEKLGHQLSVTEQINHHMIDREVRMIELKKENALLRQRLEIQNK